jgi:membrane-associated phospholipid phosphatase
MKNLLPVFRSNRAYFLILVLIMLAVLSLVMIFGQGFGFISLNQQHPFFLNVFFINYTFLGDGFFALALAVFYFFYLNKKREGFLLTGGFILSTLIVQLVKNSVDGSGFKLFFEQGQYLFFSDESVLANVHSFPSGHTANAFMIVTIIVLSLKKPKWQIPVLAAAVLLGISRMYMAQDRLMDVTTGAFIGAGSALVSYWLVENIKYITRSLIKMSRPGYKSSLETGKLLHAQ